MGEIDDNPASQARDFYHHGVITKLFPSNNTGIVRTESGRELPFSYEFVILCGEAKTVQDLKEGEPVGYDLGWTSSGLKITKIKTYPRYSAEGGPSSLKGQGS
jgi:hypothetical protein